MSYSGPVLVTGAAGFIGSHLCDALLHAGCEVLAADRVEPQNASNLSTALQNSRFQYRCGDLSQPEFVAQCVLGVSHIAHLAAMASVPASIKNPAACHADTLTSTLNLLAAAGSETTSFVYASSAAVYGDTDQLPVSEQAATSPQSPYAAAKLAGENYLRAFAHSGLNALALRFFNVYGPRQDPDSPYSGVISIFADRLRKGLPITIFGDGEQTRDFIFVGDVVRVIELALQSTNAGGSVINVGRGLETSLLTLLKTMQLVTGSQIEVRHKPARAGDIKRSVAKVDKLLALTGFTPETSIEQGIKQALQV